MMTTIDDCGMMIADEPTRLKIPSNPQFKIRNPTIINHQFAIINSPSIPINSYEGSLHNGRGR